MDDNNQQENLIVKKKSFPIWTVIAVTVVLIGTMVGAVVFARAGNEKKATNQLELARKYVSGLDYEQAIIAYEATIEIDPNNVDAYLELAELYQKNGETQKTEALLNEAIKIASEEERERIENMIDGIRNVMAPTAVPENNLTDDQVDNSIADQETNTESDLSLVIKKDTVHIENDNTLVGEFSYSRPLSDAELANWSHGGSLYDSYGDAVVWDGLGPSFWSDSNGNFRVGLSENMPGGTYTYVLYQLVDGKHIEDEIAFNYSGAKKESVPTPVQIPEVTNEDTMGIATIRADNRRITATLRTEGIKEKYVRNQTGLDKDSKEYSWEIRFADGNGKKYDIGTTAWKSGDAEYESTIMEMQHSLWIENADGGGSMIAFAELTIDGNLLIWTSVVPDEYEFDDKVNIISYQISDSNANNSIEETNEDLMTSPTAPEDILIDDRGTDSEADLTLTIKKDTVHIENGNTLVGEFSYSRPLTDDELANWWHGGWLYDSDGNEVKWDGFGPSFWSSPSGKFSVGLSEKMPAGTYTYVLYQNIGAKSIDNTLYGGIPVRDEVSFVYSGQNNESSPITQQISESANEDSFGSATIRAENHRITAMLRTEGIKEKYVRNQEGLNRDSLEYAWEIKFVDGNGKKYSIGTTAWKFGDSEYESTILEMQHSLWVENADGSGSSWIGNAELSVDGDQLIWTCVVPDEYEFDDSVYIVSYQMTDSNANNSIVKTRE